MPSGSRLGALGASHSWMVKDCPFGSADAPLFLALAKAVLWSADDQQGVGGGVGRSSSHV